jgi:hypothetical protein
MPAQPGLTTSIRSPLGIAPTPERLPPGTGPPAQPLQRASPPSWPELFPMLPISDAEAALILYQMQEGIERFKTFQDEEIAALLRV